MENKIIVQEIYINDESNETIKNETIKKEYTISELKDLIAPTFLINSYYAKCPSRYWIWQYKEELECEKWRDCPNYPQYKASDYGRIKANNDIIIPYEKYYKKDYTGEQLSTLLKKDLNNNNVGYLLVKPDLSVHQLVADAWLKPFRGKIPNGDNLEIHHISNDGYDNNPHNLIYVLKTTHTGKGGIHKGLTGKIVSFYSCYPGPRKKLI